MRVRDFAINMGRTIPSYRMAIDIEIAKWKPFRDALRKRDKEICKNMLLRSKLYASAGGMAVRPIVLEAMFMSILLDQHKRLLELVAGIEKLKNPGSAKEPEGIEKFLLPPPHPANSICQTAFQATLSQEDSS
jgi:hypothetical protein